MQVKIAGFCSASDCLGFIRPRDCQKHWANKLFTIKESVKLHIDQTIRTRNFRVRNEIVEQGAVTKSQKGKKAHVDAKVGVCFQWTANGQCSKGDSCSFRHDLASGNSGGAQRREGRSSSPAPNSKAKTDEGREKNIENPLQTQGAKFRAVTLIVKTRHVDCGILPCVKTTSLRRLQKWKYMFLQTC